VHEWDGTAWVVYDSNNIINVVDYGIIADNVTDNTALLQALLDSTKLKNKSFTIYFPANTNYYRLNNVVTINNIKPFSILGAGSDVTKFNAPNGAFVITGTVNGSTQFFKDQIKIANLTVNVIGGDFTKTGIEFFNCNMNLDDIGINGKWDKGISLKKCWFSTVNKVYGTSFVDTASEVNITHGLLQGTFMYIQSSVSININNCQTYAYRYGFFVSGTPLAPDPYKAEGLAFNNCVTQFVGYGAYLEHGTLAYFNTYTFTQCTYVGVKSIEGVGTQVINCWIEGPIDNSNLKAAAENFVGVEFGFGTTSCAVIGNNINAAAPGAKAFG
jgi:hypothetical protein